MERARPVALNGDSFFVGEPAQHLVQVPEGEAWLYSVADGLGGEGNDDVASQTAVGALERLFRGGEAMEDSAFSTPDGWLRAAYAQVNRAVCEERRIRRLQGMFTTLTTALLLQRPDGGISLYPANIGDSRMYLLRERRIIALTRDDGEGGFISRVIGDPNVFSESFLRYATTVARTRDIEARILDALEIALRGLVTDIAQADARPLASLFLTLLEGVCPVDLAPAYSRPLGILYDGLGANRFKSLVASLAQSYETSASALAPFPLEPGDRLLLCSDGISNAFSEGFLQEVLGMELAANPGEEVLETILSWLLETPGRVDDDRTAVVVRLTPLI